MQQFTLAVVVGAVAFMGGLACAHTPDAPGSIPKATPVITPPAGPVASMRTFTIVSGWDHAAVANAPVTIAGVAKTTDATGHVQGLVSTGDTFDIDATGFLPRRTSVENGVSEITLWPAASDAEAQAIRSIVYSVNDVRYPAAEGAFFVTTTFAGVDATVASSAWRQEAAAFGAEFGLTYVFSNGFLYEVNELEVGFDGIAAPWNCDPSGAPGLFCRVSSPYREFKVRPDAATRPELIRRVLASWFLASNPLPGLLNVGQPAGSLSLLERQAIRMILQRKHANRWPDTDRPVTKAVRSFR